MVNHAESGPASGAGPVASKRAADGWSAVGGVLLSALYLWVLVWLALAVVVPYAVWRWQPLVITSGSMAPLIRAGDVVLGAAPVHPVAAGQVITYANPAQPGSLNTHRVVAVEPDGSYRTRGDANASVDSTPVPAGDVVARGRLLVPMVGLPLLWLSDAPLAFALWVVATVVAALVAIGPRRRPPGAGPAGGHRTPAEAPASGPHRGSPTLTPRPSPPRPSPQPFTARRFIFRLATSIGLIVTLAIAVAGANVVGRSTAAFSASTSNVDASYQAAGPLTPPSDLTADQTCGGATPSAELSWTATPDTWADGYSLSRDGGPPQAIAGRTTTTATDGPLVNGTAYTWQLSATAGPWTSSRVGVTLTPHCPPTYVASTTFQSLGPSAAITVPASTQTGDLLITFTGTSNPNVTAPAGWNLLRADDHGAAGSYTKVYWRVATAGDPGTTYTWTSSGSVYGGGSVMLVYRGIDQTTPFDTHGGGIYSGTTSLTAPSITTTVGDTRLVALYFHEAGGDTSTTITEPPGMTEVFEGGSASRTMEVADEEFAATGATGSRTATASKADDGIGVLIALRASG